MSFDPAPDKPPLNADQPGGHRPPPSEMSGGEHSASRTALRIAAAYVAVSLLWILLSDRILEWFVSADWLSRVQTLKGSLFVAVTGGLLLLLVRTPLRRLESQKEEARRLLRALEYRSRFETLISDLSTRFIDLPADGFDAGVQSALREICAFLRTDTGYVSLFEQGGRCCAVTHYWQRDRDGVTPGSEPESAIDDSDPWMARLREGSLAVADAANPAPDHPAMRRRLAQCRCQALIDIPMIYRGESVGFLGFASDEASRVWTADEKALLGLLGQVFTNALKRRESETHRLRLEDRLRQSQKLEAVGQLAGGIAHDFSNLLQAIQGYAELAQMTGPLPEPLGEYLGEIRQSTDRARSLIRRLMAFSRQEAPRLETVAMDGVIQGLLKTLERLIGEHIEVDRSGDPDLWKVRADPRQVELVLINLIVNARDAMPDGGRIAIETRNVEVTVRQAEANPPARAGRHVCLRVTDTGCGIPAAIRHRVFEPFFTTKAVGAGTGLGLSTVYGIVQQHEGFIELDSRESGGTSFRLYFPAADGAGPAAAAAGNDDAEILRGHGETILLAEDDATVRDLVTRILTRGNYRVLAAVDGDEALRLFRDAGGGIALALLDVVMPGTSGPLVRDAIRAGGSDMPVLFCSGYSGAGEAPITNNDPRCRLIHKPISPTTLLREVHQLLAAG